MRNDILHDNGELLFVDGDFKVGHSDLQHVQDIVLSQKGEWKAHPLCGFGAINYIKSRITTSEFKRDLKIQLEYDGYKNVDIDFDEYGKLNIEL